MAARCPNCGALLVLEFEMRPHPKTRIHYGADEHERGILRLVSKLYHQGVTQTRIVEELNTRGLTSRSAKRKGGKGRWTASMVNRLIQEMLLLEKEKEAGQPASHSPSDTSET